jgi:hypothetical protein
MQRRGMTYTAASPRPSAPKNNAAEMVSSQGVEMDEIAGQYREVRGDGQNRSQT